VDAQLRAPVNHDLLAIDHADGAVSVRLERLDRTGVDLGYIAGGMEFAIEASEHAEPAHRVGGRGPNGVKQVARPIGLRVVMRELGAREDDGLWALDEEVREKARASDAEPLSHWVVHRLEEKINRGELKAGTLLPSQRALAAELGVSRSSLREALSVMETLGLVSSQPGGRTRVIDASNSSAQDKITVRWRYASRYTEQDVYELRLLLEARAARLAAEKVTSQTLANLTVCLAAMKDAIRQGDLLTAALKDFEFHDIIIALSGLFKEIHDTNREAILETQKMPLARDARLWEPVQEHERILQALEQRDPEHIIRAAERIRVHLQA
jgi:GntR family transcriptional repressor for pyruvate dehydrogenase complex